MYIGPVSAWGWSFLGLIEIKNELMMLRGSFTRYQDDVFFCAREVLCHAERYLGCSCILIPCDVGMSKVFQRIFAKFGILWITDLVVYQI